MKRNANMEMQLASVAAAVDRANRPASLLTIPVLLLLASVLYLVWAMNGFGRRWVALEAQIEQTKQIRATVNAIVAEQSKGVDLVSLYPNQPYFGSYVDEIWKQQIGFREPPVVSQVSSQTAIASPPIARSDVTCSVNNESLEQVMKAIDSTLAREFLRGHTFVSQATLVPTGAGWRATVRFSLYEKK